MYKLYVMIIIIITVIIISSIRGSHKEKFEFTSAEEAVLRTFAQKTDLLSKIGEISTMNNTYRKQSDDYNEVDERITRLNIPANLESKLLTPVNILDINKSGAFFDGVSANDINTGLKYSNFEKKIEDLESSIDTKKTELNTYLNDKASILERNIADLAFIANAQSANAQSANPQSANAQSADNIIIEQIYINNVDKSYKFIYKIVDNIRGQTEYTLNINSVINCNILIVGGGGGGGNSNSNKGGGGGGAGGYLYMTNVTLSPGRYKIIVGNGGATSQIGYASYIEGGNIKIQAIGGMNGIDDSQGGNGGKSGGTGNTGGTTYSTILITTSYINNNAGIVRSTEIAYIGGAGGGGALEDNYGRGADTDKLYGANNGGAGGQGIVNGLIIYARGGRGGNGMKDGIPNGIVEPVSAETGNGGNGGHGGPNNKIGTKGGSGVVIININN